MYWNKDNAERWIELGRSDSEAALASAGDLATYKIDVECLGRHQS